MSKCMVRVAVGLSGGVDSTVSALLLRQQKHFELVGVHMTNWDIRDETGHCQAAKEEEMAADIANRLGIPFKTVNLVKEYWSSVFTPMVQSYKDGLTPNPDVECNARIKFDAFHQKCQENFECGLVATGHYARTSFGDFYEHFWPGKSCKLLIAADKFKDQTFFLATVSEASLRRSIFPVGSMPKSVVKEVARTSGFEDVARRKESTGICFIGKRRHGFQKFMDDYVEPKEGEFVDVDSGKVIGRHRGVHLWTVGQKTKICTTNQEKAFVLSKDASTQRILTCFGTNHPALFCENFYTLRPHWISGKPPSSLLTSNGSLEIFFRLQNAMPLTKGVISFSSSTQSPNYECVDPNRLIVSSVEPLRAVTPGQFVAFYVGEECIGGAEIERPGCSIQSYQGQYKAAS